MSRRSLVGVTVMLAGNPGAKIMHRVGTTWSGVFQQLRETPLIEGEIDELRRTFYAH